MQEMIYVSIIVLLMIIVILCMRLWLYKKQIIHIKEELSMLGNEDTNYRLSSYCRIGKTEDLIAVLNETINKYREEIFRLKKDNRLYKESITSISHDIRTPLTSAKGYTQMLYKGELEDEKRQLYINKVEQRIDDVTEMLNQLFEYARVEAGELEFVMEKINLNNVFVETLSMFYDDFVVRNCEPAIYIEETPCYIYADKRAVIRIIENLIKNGLVHGNGDYCFKLNLLESKKVSRIKEKGKQVVSHKTECREMQGVGKTIERKMRVVLSVSNKTDSIEEKDMEHIFDRFYTTDQSRTRKTTGLGLAIVKRFVKQMGGEVRAELEGDIFRVEIEFEVV